MLSALRTMQTEHKTTFAGDLRLNEPMSKHTSWRVGGVADRFYIPKNSSDLELFIKSVPLDEPLYWLGLGSNILVRDGGIRGTVIVTCGRLKRLELMEPFLISAEAGVPCAQVARFASKRDLVGAEFFAGIPGTIGGALSMNAGAFGGETWNLVKRVTTISRAGYRRIRVPGDYSIGYRSVIGPDQEWFLSAELRLKSGNARESQAQIKRLLTKRAQTQPTKFASCGSVFRNPKDNYAASLIEASGLKGTRIGDAYVSEKHANFILNKGNASATDIEALIRLIMEQVDHHQGIRLHPEVRIIGENAGVGL